MWHFELSSDLGVEVFICAGSLTIGSQLGATFTGTFLIRDQNCGELRGTVTSGTLSPTGEVTFALNVSGPDPNLLTAAFGCTYVSGDQVVTGTLIESQLQAESRTVMDCVRGGRATMFLRLSGGK
jgi:hypothetical protein